MIPTNNNVNPIKNLRSLLTEHTIANANKPRKSKDSIDLSKLPSNVLINIFSNLDVREIGRNCRICKAWKETADSPVLWEKLLKRDYPNFIKKDGEKRSAKILHRSERLDREFKALLFNYVTKTKN